MGIVDVVVVVWAGAVEVLDTVSVVVIVGVEAITT